MKTSQRTAMDKRYLTWTIQFNPTAGPLKFKNVWSVNYRCISIIHIIVTTATFIYTTIFGNRWKRQTKCFKHPVCLNYKIHIFALFILSFRPTVAPPTTTNFMISKEIQLKVSSNHLLVLVHHHHQHPDYRGFCALRCCLPQYILLETFNWSFLTES